MVTCHANDGLENDYFQDSRNKRKRSYNLQKSALFPIYLHIIRAIIREKGFNASTTEYSNAILISQNEKQTTIKSD